MYIYCICIYYFTNKRNVWQLKVWRNLWTDCCQPFLHTRVHSSKLTSWQNTFTQRAFTFLIISHTHASGILISSYHIDRAVGARNISGLGANAWGLVISIVRIYEHGTLIIAKRSYTQGVLLTSSPRTFTHLNFSWIISILTCTTC